MRHRVVIFRTRHDLVRLDLIAVFLPCLAQCRIDPGFERFGMLLGLDELNRHVAELRPGRIQLVDVETGNAVRFALGTPLALAEHDRLVSILNDAAAFLAGVNSGPRLALRPFHIRPLERLHRLAVRTWHKIPTLVRFLECRLNARDSRDGRCRANVPLSICKCRCSPKRQR